MKRWLALCAALLCLWLPAWAGAETPAVPTGPAGTYVFDYANLLGDADIQAMDDAADALNGETGAMAICVTVDALDGMNSKDFAYDLFNGWGIGDKDRNDGVLLLFSRGDRVIEITTGTGLEEILTDADAGQLLDDHAMPHLQDGAYAKGIRTAFVQLCRSLTQAEGKTPSASDAAARNGK